MLSLLLLLLLFIGQSCCQQSTSLTTLPTSSSSQYVNTSSSSHKQQQLPAESVLHSLTEDDFHSLPFAAEEWPSSAASFERPLSKVDLLALKVDHSLMSSLDKWLARYGIKMPQSVLKTIDEMDLCPERASDGMIRKCILHCFVRCHTFDKRKMIKNDQNPQIQLRYFRPRLNKVSLVQLLLHSYCYVVSLSACFRRNL